VNGRVRSDDEGIIFRQFGNNTNLNDLEGFRRCLKCGFL
jgi:hypothetical protein